ncbi:DUF3265 domain-containing protein [Salmonella enterica subsp. enterica serovar Goldcoast]|nr:DUF3265 domain-containing protein [Salmonella enterica subsp. enterica serovar Goldcoast]
MLKRDSQCVAFLACGEFCVKAVCGSFRSALLTP